ncbi:MAG: sodium-dependent transporter [Alphaproteobacteria bacterium]|nr:sodium-dependent transporter [Alphaproteobacteria bacterium]
MNVSHETWSSRFVFLMAAVGSAVGLGNIWRFPYLAGENGGGAFVLVYLLCVALIGLPLIVAELVIGRRAKQSAVGSARTVAREAGASGRWVVVGWLGVVAAFLILSYYSVIGGWLLAYLPMTASGAFTGVEGAAVATRFETFLGDPWGMTLAHALFMAATVLIVARGVRAGIEQGVKIMMPALFAILVLLVAYAAVEGEFVRALSFLFTVDFSRIDTEVVINAIGQAFFSLSVGMGAMITYGAYLQRDTDIPSASVTIAVADTAVAILAGLAIFPIVFEVGLDPSGGPGLLFKSLPYAFGHMPLGAAVGALFFLFGLFAALTSSIALLEIVVSWAEEHRGWKRSHAAALIGAVVFVVGLLTVFSFNILPRIAGLGFLKIYGEDPNVFGLLDLLTNNLILPVGGILIALLVGYVMRPEIVREEYGADPLFGAWWALLRYAVPLAIAVVMVFELARPFFA